MEKDKVLLLTLWGNFNYGNKLQNFALKKMIEKLGYEVVIVKLLEKDNIRKKLKLLIKKYY